MATTVQGDFPGDDAAQRAKSELIRSGIAPGNIRVWNILPDSDGASSSGRGAATGAVVGGAVGGGIGIAVGAALGDALGDDKPRLPLPSGVRVVVDAQGNEDALLSALRAAGGANVRTSTGSG